MSLTRVQQISVSLDGFATGEGLGPVTRAKRLSDSAAKLSAQNQTLARALSSPARAASMMRGEQTSG
jgi:hypothetical protein